MPENYLAASELIDFDRSTLTTIPTNPFSALSVPTYITKVEDCYFIVDCYNNQVIYHDNLTDPLYEWYIMTNDISMLEAAGIAVCMLNGSDDAKAVSDIITDKTVDEDGWTVFVEDYIL